MYIQVRFPDGDYYAIPFAFCIEYTFTFTHNVYLQNKHHLTS